MTKLRPARQIHRLRWVLGVTPDLHGPAAMRRWWDQPTAPLLAVAAVMLGVHLATNGLYGLHTDELYYILSGQHPALGYVDFPPVTPLLALLNTSLFGIHPWTLRLFPALTDAVVVLLAGLSAREMGAGRGVSTFASVTALLSPLLLATWLFQTVEFDLLIWVIALYLLLRMLRTGDRRIFIWIGVDLGVGLETKLTILGLCAGLAVAMLLSQELRESLRTRYPWIGLTITAALAAPNVGWQIANGFPTLTYIHNHSGDIANGGGIVAFFELFVLTIGPLMLPLWVAGLVLLFRDRRFRPVAVLTVVAILVFLPNGKGYYPAPTAPIVLAAGCLAVARIASKARRRWVVGLTAAGALLEIVVLLLVLLPVVPPSSMHRVGLDKLNPDMANTVGWPEFTAQVGAVYNSLPPEQRSSTAILTSIDGQAGAIDIYGASEHLPQAISPHLNFWYWKPAKLDATTLVVVGYRPSQVAFLCGSVTSAGTVRIPYSVDNLNQGTPILICTNLRESISAAWPSLRDFG